MELVKRETCKKGLIIIKAGHSGTKLEWTHKYIANLFKQKEFAMYFLFRIKQRNCILFKIVKSNQEN